MKNWLILLCLHECVFRVLTECAAEASEFHLDGDYSIGGLFGVHYVVHKYENYRPEGIRCASQPLYPSSYRRFQIMRFAVEEINNSSDLLPNVSLGYEIFDECSASQNFPGIFSLISVKDSVQPWLEPERNLSHAYKVLAVVGPFSSSETWTVAPLFMMDLIPLVSYGAASSDFSEKAKFPSFMRTVHSNKDIIDVVVTIVLHFRWRWVAFLNSEDDFGTNGLDLFRARIKNTDICMPYNSKMYGNKNYSNTFKQIEEQKIIVIIVFAPRLEAQHLIKSAVELNVTNKVWIAGDTWSLNKNLLKLLQKRSIGTVLGVSQPVVTIPGFNEFVFSSSHRSRCADEEEHSFCNQICNCSDMSPQLLISMDPSFSFPVYSATYAVAHALHNVLQCGSGRCSDNITVYPYMVLKELKRSNFLLLDRNINFDQNGDPQFGTYSIVFWNKSGDAEEIGSYNFYPSVHYVINDSQIEWYTNGEVPTSLCSPECSVGHKKQPDGIHACCFTCEICGAGTYVNITEDPYRCNICAETEWSTEGSTSCALRTLEYVPFSDVLAILIMLGACALLTITLVISVLFAVNYNTPVVRSAGGPMCFLMLGCLSVSSTSVFFYFEKPTLPLCILRVLPFILFYTVCIACFVVRSFQIVCIFKIGAKFPKIQNWWMKYHGQWLTVTVIFVTQALIFTIGYSTDPPVPYNETVWYPDKIILSCYLNAKGISGCLAMCLCMCCLCFIFSYMGKDLPKNYNESKSITFCLLLLIATWTLFVTECMLYRGKDLIAHKALAVLSSLYSLLLWYFLPKCYIIIFQPHKNTPQYFQGLIQNYTKTISQ